MTSKSIIFSLVVVCCVVLLCKAQYIIPVTKADEKEVCEEMAYGRTVTGAMKSRPFPCKVECSYDDGSKEVYNIREGKPCCEIGVMPTGCCKAGRCPPVMGMLNCM